MKKLLLPFPLLSQYQDLTAVDSSELRLARSNNHLL